MKNIWHHRDHLLRSIQGLLAGRGWSRLLERIRSDHPEIVGWWSMHVMRELYHPLWVNHIKTKSFPVVVDVGANVGCFCEFVTSLNYRAWTIAIEPNTDAAQYIKTSVVKPVAAGRARAQGALIRQSRLDPSAHIEIVDKDDPMLCLFHHVVICPLDELLQETSSYIDVLKIDVQGHEIEVLAGAYETLKRTKFIIIESISGPVDIPGFRLIAKMSLVDYLYEKTTPPRDR